MLLVVIAVICIPWMLFAKPALILRNKRKMHVPVSSSWHEARQLVCNVKYILKTAKGEVRNL
jgi:hypothetical protein